MRSPGFICFALLFSLIGSKGVSEELEFTGSFWDTADSYRLTIGFEKSPARLEWDGYADNDIGRQKNAPGRITFGFDLTEEETSLLRSLKTGLPHCHNGHRMMLGTSLSNTARVWHKGELKQEQLYFHIEPNAILGQRMSGIPLSFQTKIADGVLSENEKTEWFEEIRELASATDTWQKALNTLARAKKDNTKIPWPTILAASYAAEDSRTSEAFKKELAFAYEAEAVIDILLSQSNRAEYFPELGAGQVVVRINDIYKTDIDEWYSVSPPHDLGHDSDQWRLAPPALLRLIEDFISADGGNISGYHHHGFLDLVEPKKGYKDDYLKRLKFIESSNWLTSLTGGENESQSASQLRIFTITFEEKMSKCVVLTRNDDEARFTLLQVEDGDWRILRQIDATDWNEYRWKEPLFK